MNYKIDNNIESHYKKPIGVSFVKRMKYRNIITFKWTSIFFLALLIIFSLPIEDHNHKTASATSHWEQDTKLDFKNGTMEKVTVLPSGEIILKRQVRIIEDNYENDFNISYSRNMKLNKNEEKWELIKNIGNIDGGYYFDNTFDGGYIIVGYTISSGAGGYDVLLIKADKNLNEQWKRTFGSSSYEIGNCVQQTSDDGFIIVGTKGNNLWLIKTDIYGNEQWDKSFENGNGFSVQQTKDNGFIVGGSTSGLGGGWDGWLIKTDSSGNEQWNKTLGGHGHDHIYSVLQSSDGGFIALGLSNSYGGEDDDIWVIKTDKNGVIIWNKTYGGSSSDAGYLIKQTSDGGYVIVGRTNSYSSYSVDFWVIKINSAGIEQWNKSYDFNNGVSDIGRSIIQTRDNGFIVIGDFDPYTGSESEIIFFKINSIGNLQWKKIIGTDNFDRGYSILKDPEGDYVILVKMDYIKLIKIDKNGNVTFVNGEMISKNLLIGEKAASIKSFRYETTIPIDNKIEIQFSQDNKTWYNSERNLNKWTLLNNGKNTINISNLNWQGSNFYYKLNFTSKNLTTPSIEYIQIYFDEYIEHGTFESEPFNSSGNLTWLSLNWTGKTPKSTKINLQLRTGGTSQELFSNTFLGPDGKSNTYYTTPGTPIWLGHNNESWIQYKVYLTTDDTSKTPVLNNVTISFDYFPILLSPNVIPSSGNITTEFNFMVIYIDFDNKPPSGIFVNIDGIRYPMEEYNVTDSIISDGKEYFYKTKLKAGDHNYQFIGYDDDFKYVTKSRNLNVTYGPLYNISVFPVSIELFVGEFQLFTAEGFDLDGNHLPVEPSWEVSGGGSIDKHGNFTSSKPGTWIIYANHSGISGKAVVIATQNILINESDRDNDNILDEWEINNGLNSSDPNDADLDFDYDNLTNLEEFLHNTSPNLPDSDHDGLLDGSEVKAHGTDPLNPDSDGDGFDDRYELDKGTDPLDENDYPQDNNKDEGLEKLDYGIFLVIGLVIIIILVFLVLIINHKMKEKE